MCEIEFPLLIHAVADAVRKLLRHRQQIVAAIQDADPVLGTEYQPTQVARTRTIMPDYVAKLLATFGTALAFSSVVEAVLPEPLSVREQEILELIWTGFKNKEIAQRLKISVKTVEAHRANMMKKIRVSNTAQLLKAAIQGKMLRLR